MQTTFEVASMQPGFDEGKQFILIQGQILLTKDEAKEFLTKMELNKIGVEF
jgi:hypothetical protein